MRLSRLLFTGAASLVLALGTLVLADDVATKAELAKLVGIWAMDSYIDEGKQDPQFVGGIQTIAEDKYVVKVGDKTIRQGTFKIDPTKSPKHIDLMPAAGPYKGKTLSGIYVLDGDKLHTCFPDPGQPRPTKFDSDAGSGNSEVKYSRKK